jgi:hypothetical protein
MADGQDLSEIVRRTVQANARLYKGWVDLSLEYFRGIADIFGGTPEAAASPTDDSGVDATDAGAVVLEGESGSAAGAAFLVTNDLGRAIQCALVATDFRDADGARLRAKIAFDPAKFDLEPGKQCVVRVTVPIDDRLTEGVAYSGEFAIDGMEGFSVPVVLRRRHIVEASPIDRVAAGPSAGGATNKARGARGAASTRSKASPPARSRKGISKKAERKKAARKTPRKKS